MLLVEDDPSIREMAALGLSSAGFRVTSRVGTTQLGTIRVYEVTAMDGSQINVVDIPVTLTV